jgi:hypothetical protein
MVALLASNPRSSEEGFIIGLAVVPPIVVYVLVFVAVPWIGKGSSSLRRVNFSLNSGHAV